MTVKLDERVGNNLSIKSCTLDSLTASTNMLLLITIADSSQSHAKKSYEKI